MAIWGGRFSEDPDALVSRFGESVSFDKRLYAHDIAGTIAHVNMLNEIGIVPAEEAGRIVAELRKIHSEIDAGDFEFQTQLEDVHMNIEQRLIDRLGDVGARVHAGRSRNDQIATDIRLYLRDEITDIQRRIHSMQRALVELGSANKSVIMPGFTHLQRAQPVLFAHHLLAYVEMLARDSSRLDDCQKRMNVLPLGSAAMAGTTLPIDRDRVAKELRFDEVSRNSMDAVADRDFAIELVSALAILMMHMSRISEDIIFWSSEECSFIEIQDAFCTGSSIMPQKKNPDVAELTRGKTGRVYGSLMALLTTMKGLPLCYNRDMQEDKQPIFDAVDTVKDVLAVYALMIKGIRVNEQALRRSASDPALMATDLAEWLVSKGVPFRTAHHQVGELVSRCISDNLSLTDLSLADMRAIIPDANEECMKLFDPERSVQSRDTFGGTAPRQVANQLAYWKERLDEND